MLLRRFPWGLYLTLYTEPHLIKKASFFFSPVHIIYLFCYYVIIDNIDNGDFITKNQDKKSSKLFLTKEKSQTITWKIEKISYTHTQWHYFTLIYI